MVITIECFVCDAGVQILVFPGAFNMKTGPLHWELLLRARAVDEQVFVAGVSPAQDTNADYVAWGHSMVVDPWGKVLKSAEFQEEIIIADLGTLNICLRCYYIILIIFGYVTISVFKFTKYIVCYTVHSLAYPSSINYKIFTRMHINSYHTS